MAVIWTAKAASVRARSIQPADQGHQFVHGLDLVAGAEPREPIRFAFGPGTQNVLLTTRSEVYQQIGDQPQQDLSTPVVTMPLTAAAVPPSPTGPADRVSRHTAPALPP